MARRRSGIARDSDTPFSAHARERGGGAILAYRVSVVGMIPGLGLILGPIAMLLGLGARLKHRKDKGFKGRSTANAAIILGALLGITNWIGLMMMLHGLEVL